MMSAATYWVLAHEKGKFDLTKQTAAYQKASAELLSGWLATNKKSTPLEDWAQNLPNNLQNQWQKLQHTLVICQMISLQQEGAGAAKNLATTFAELYQTLDYGLILPFVRSLPAENVWAETARASLHHGLLQALNQLTLQRLQSKEKVGDAVSWLAANKADWPMITQILRDIRYQQKADFALLSLLQQKLMS
jgi:NAD-specific glutamate dehydrogenase